MNQRLLQFDIAKAICIVLVAIGHYVPEGSPAWYDSIHDWIYMFHMPVFMFASGYIYLAFKKDEPYSTFITKKVKRLMGPYLMVSLLIVTIKLLSQRGLYVENPVTLASYFRIFYIPEAGYFLWFVWALFTMFCIVPLLKTKSSRLVMFGVAIILHYWRPIEYTHIFSINETVKTLVWFMLGCMCFDHKSALEAIGKQRMNIIKCACIFAFALCTTAFSLGYIDRNCSLMRWLGIAAVMAISNTAAEYGQQKWMKPVIILGGASYTIYLFHTTFMGFAKAFVHKIPMMNGGDDLWFTIGAVIVVGTGITCPLLLHRYVLPRWKMTRMLFGVK